MTRLIFSVAVGVAVLTVPAFAQGVQLTVQANDRKYNGQVWDGAEVYGPAALPTNTPPDLAVCVAPFKGEPFCLERKEGVALKSLCQNSHSCTFNVVVNAREPYGLFIYDIDLKFHDLVDAVIVVPNAKTERTQTMGIEVRLREWMEQKTPAFTPMEKDRRKRETFVVTSEQCKDGCALSQSTVRLR